MADEQRKAAATLGVADVEFLGYPDGRPRPRPPVCRRAGWRRATACSTPADLHQLSDNARVPCAKDVEDRVVCWPLHTVDSADRAYASCRVRGEDGVHIS